VCAAQLVRIAELEGQIASLLDALESIENDDGHIPQDIWNMRNFVVAKARGVNDE
jgi:hypothetical protein